MMSTAWFGRVPAAWRRLALLGLLSAAGCGRDLPDTSVGVDTAAVTGPYALEPGTEAPAQPQPTRAPRFHLVTRRVRHRHAGPR